MGHMAMVTHMHWTGHMASNSWHLGARACLGAEGAVFKSNLNAPRAARNTEHAVPTAPRIHKVIGALALTNPRNADGLLQIIAGRDS